MIFFTFVRQYEIVLCNTDAHDGKLCPDLQVGNSSAGLLLEELLIFNFNS